MAKMFYSMEEAQQILGKSADEIRQLVKDNKLRALRDGTKLTFKTDAVDQLKAELAGNASAGHEDQIPLAPDDSVGPLSLADSPSASATGIALADTGEQPAQSPGDTGKGDTDMDMSGSQTAIPSPGRVTLTSGSGLGGSTMGGTRGGSGISVFSADEVEHADPGAQTAISPSDSGDFNLESVGSGSGLLDLTRESDDTSLGASVLDEIAPGDTGVAGPPKGIGDSTAATAAETEPPRLTGGRQYIGQTYELADPSAPAFGGAALGAFFVLLVGAYVLIGALIGSPDTLAASLASYGFWMIAAGGLVVSIIFFIIGLILGRTAS